VGRCANVRSEEEDDLGGLAANDGDEHGDMILCEA
jgi:hypothetical protein